MLALRLEQGRRGGSEGHHLQKDAQAPAWQSSPSARLSSPRQGIAIREKISQWEGRSQQQGSSQDSGVRAYPPAASRRMSEDVLGNGALGVKVKPKVGLSKSLEFWEGQQSVVGRRSEPALKNFSDFTSAPTGNKPLTAQRFTSPKLEANIATSRGTPILPVRDKPKSNQTLDAEVASNPLPLSAEEEDNMPAGNFYASRGFWRKLEGDRLLWEKGRESVGEAQPPPKPLRTFQYQGADARSARKASPPTDPPPLSPAARTNGLSRHKKNRWVQVTVKNRK